MERDVIVRLRANTHQLEGYIRDHFTRNVHKVGKKTS